MMQIGNAAWGLRETPLEEQLKLTSAMGLRLLELSIAGYDKDFLQVDATAGQIAEVRELFSRHGIALDCACTGNDFTGDDAEEQLAKVKTVIGICGQLGVKALRIFAGFQSDSVVIGARFDRMLECLTKLSAHATRKELDDICLVLDINPPAGCDDSLSQIMFIKRHLAMIRKFDGERLR